MSDPAPSHLDRRSFLIGGAVIAGSLYVGMRLAENRFDKPGLRPGLHAQCIPAHHARRQGHGDHRQVRDGPGHLHRARDGGGRGTRHRSQARNRGVRAGGPGLQCAVRAGAVHRRQHEHQHHVHAAARGGREGACHAGGGGGRSLEGRRRCAAHRGWQGIQWPQVAELRRAGGRRLEAGAAREGGAQGSRAVSLPGQAAQAARCAHEGGRQREVRHRPACAGHVVRGVREAPGDRRHAGKSRRHGRARRAGRDRCQTTSVRRGRLRQQHLGRQTWP